MGEMLDELATVGGVGPAILSGEPPVVGGSFGSRIKPIGKPVFELMVMPSIMQFVRHCYLAQKTECDRHNVDLGAKVLSVGLEGGEELFQSFYRPGM